MLILLLSICLLLGVFLIFRPNQILSKEFVKSKLLTPESKFISWKGNDIHYTEEGRGDTVIMIHGLGGSFYNFEGLKDIMKNNFHIIRPDIPGMGMSDFRHLNKNTNFTAEYIDFFSFFIESLKLERFYVMGNSLGGMLAWMIAETYPEKVKGLVLFNSAGYESEKVIKHAAGPLRWSWFAPVLNKGIPKFLIYNFLPRLFGDKSKVTQEELLHAHYLINRESNLKTIAGLSSNTSQAPNPELIKKISVPTLIFWGKEDIIIPVRHAKLFNQDISGSQSIIYSPCGHMAMIEYPEDVYNNFKSYFGLA